MELEGVKMYRAGRNWGVFEVVWLNHRLGVLPLHKADRSLRIQEKNCCKVIRFYMP